MRPIRSLAAVLTLAGITAVAACPAPQNTANPGEKPRAAVDPDRCGGYAINDTGRKVRAFLEATVLLDRAVADTEAYLRQTCVLMGNELGIKPTGDTRAVCLATKLALDEALAAGVKAGARVDVDYKPAVCAVDASIAAKAAAECEARAEADIDVTCYGECSGTCTGLCDGECVGAAGPGAAEGQCAAECRGTCNGQCSGQCYGHAEVDGSAECRASAEVRANIEAKCEPPELKVDAKAEIVIDQAKADMAMAAFRVGMPRLLVVERKVTGPLAYAFAAWARASTELFQAAGGLLKALGKQALCVAAEITAAFQMISRIEASISIQVEVSASVRASAGPPPAR